MNALPSNAILYREYAVTSSEHILSEVDKDMYNVIQKFCNNTNENGLLLLDMPTGSGKTYFVLKYITDAVTKNCDDRKYFFITTLKKNLPIEDLRRNFKNAGFPELFDEKFIFIDSNSDSAINGFKKDVIKSIPESIKKADEYKNFESSIAFIQNFHMQKNNPDAKKMLAIIDEKFRTEIEPKFRRYVQDLLFKTFATVQDRKNAIKTGSKWQWIGALYPSVFIGDKKIIFMSVDKFLSQISTIVEPSYFLYNSDIIDKAIIFIDEFDSAKDTILKNIIQNGLRDGVDCIKLFKNIYASLQTHKLPSILTTPSKKRQESEYKKSLQSIIEGFTEKAKAIYELYTLQFSHKTETITDENTSNFLFQDHQYLSILNGNKSYISSVSDNTKRINSIQFTESKPEDETGSIQVMLGKIRGFIAYFLGGVNILALNYQQYMAERRLPNKEEFSHESAIRTVLAEFGLDDTYINYLTPQILINSRKRSKNLEESSFDLSFYQNGFRYYAFEDDYSHDTQSKIMMYSFQITPEKLMLKFCEKAKVVGISATATIPSSLGNFDIEYLKRKLQDKYAVISDEDRKRLDDDFKKTISKYGNININTKLINSSNYSQDSWLEIKNDKEVSKLFYDYIERTLPDEENSYHKERYLRISIAFKEFITKDDINSFLCVLTKHPREGDKTLDKEVLDKILNVIVKLYHSKFDVKNHVVQLDGDDYDYKKEKIIERLSNGEKLFVISVYQTIGAGQNLQYKIPENLHKNLEKINDFEENSCKDFDAIYLDKPTNLIVPLDQNLIEEDFVKYLFQIEMLQEVSELSPEDTRYLVKSAFRTFTKKTKVKNDAYVKNPRECDSTKLLSTRLIIQALGRICRTNMKSKNIYIYADSRIAEAIDSSIAEGRNLNCEFSELLKIIPSKSTDFESNVLLGEASLKSVRVNRFIKTMMPNKTINEDWTDQRIEQWKKLRELVLSKPTMSKAEVDKNLTAYNFYLRLPVKGNTIYYSEDNDFNNITISFAKTDATEKCVSAEAAKLTKLMQIDFLKKCFEKNGWATHFPVNDYIMTPPLFNNIYRGALGEVVGKAWFHEYVNTELKEIDDNSIFEFFDYKIPNTSIYVDLKNWHESTHFDIEKTTSAIISKAKKCNAKCIIIANIISSSYYKIKDTVSKEGIRLILIPALLLEDQDNIPSFDAMNKIRRCICEYSN